ncbi:phage integrase SAM-like domain-containing protein [Dysgonomonas sp. BGC7]|uniref:phage integrase SAM-like domain-containing protein n=1 Tax=Dysgonomonas sp. BGC7 TaxID=1658008 RepID=UPI003510B689
MHSDHNERCRKLLGVEYSQSTIYKFDPSLKYLKEFMSIEMSIEGTPLKEINEYFIRKYELYLKTEKGCANNSAIKHLKILRKLFVLLWSMTGCRKTLSLLSSLDKTKYT